jgi:stage III sporulation protein AD
MIIKIGIMAIVGVVLLSLLKNSGSAYSALVQIGVMCVILISVIPDIKSLMSSVNDMGIAEDVSMESIKIMIKIFSVLTVGAFCSDICRDNGESAIADTVELSSKVIAVGCAMPVITSVVSVAVSFLKG